MLADRMGSGPNTTTMTRRERLMATLQGKKVDRPAVNFYELNGLDQDPSDPDPYNVFNHPSWAPLVQLTRQRTDRIVMRGAVFRDVLPDPLEELTQVETWEEPTPQGSSLYTRRTIKVGQRKLTNLTRRDQDQDTVWTLEHPLKDVEDLKFLLDLPAPRFVGQVDPSNVEDAEAILGDSGIVMLDSPDPLCLAAGLFHMSDYTVIALTEQTLFHRLLERFAAFLVPKIEAVAATLPGRLWRIYGPEYAAPPYLPPRLFKTYVVEYMKPIIAAIHRTGGFVRLHCHGNLAAVLPEIAEMGVDAIDPVEPPPQGDVDLGFVRERYGKSLVLFGNIEVSEIETLPTKQFELRVRKCIEAGTRGEGRGFVLMPTACPIGRELSQRAFDNYHTMVRVVEDM